MVPEVPHHRTPLTTCIKFSPPCSPEAQLNLLFSRKIFPETKRMKLPGKKLIPLVVFTLSTLSILRLLKITITTSFTSPPLHAMPQTQQQIRSPPVAWNKTPSHTPSTSKSSPENLANATILTEKEFKFLKNLITHKAPCNLLIFGLEHQYITLSSVNAGGITVFLEDDLDKISKIKGNSNRTRIFKVEYPIPAKKAYKLLQHARRNQKCTPSSGLAQQSACELTLKKLPQEVYDLKWDMVVVDGPSGNDPEAPGRMAAIYTASMIARAGNTADVIVHDIDRTIEKWFSWEFLCEENLVSSKGKFWNFRIKSESNSTRFCSSGTK
ncbi:Polysacc_synt_4 domain-containing protein [Cephalotus follicularis]|uniref:Polysacc_synt_4 domain-containing protein n=1 Tax=Cephalotus follicularis TaxID=3775 RepID=A0A1Q3C243_CEPFO|nr:Polysacc_synt_4 domain-containing protein [Cephalotus follicularis]